jgi:hypothetical protein
MGFLDGTGSLDFREWEWNGGTGFFLFALKRRKKEG